MKALRILSLIIGLGALAYYAYQYFGKPNGKIYDVDKNHHVYYKGDGVTKDDAKKTGDYFTQIGLFKGDNEFDVQISAEKDSKDLKIAYVVDKAKINTEMEKGFLQISTGLADNVFNSKKMMVSLVDEKMDDIKTLGSTTPGQTQPQTQTDSTTNQTDDAK